MVTKVISSVKICDMCGDEKANFIDGKGEKLTAVRGFVQSQSDRWEKSISINITASIPYHPCDDICTDCLKESLEQMISEIER